MYVRTACPVRPGEGAGTGTGPASPGMERDRLGARTVGRRKGRRGRAVAVLRGFAFLVAGVVACAPVAWAAHGLRFKAMPAGMAPPGPAGAEAAPAPADGEAAGHWRLVVEPAGGSRGATARAWAAGRDAAGRWTSFPGRREGDRWIFEIPAYPPLAEVRFGAAPEGRWTDDPAGRLRDPGLPVRWEVTWQAGPRDGGDGPTGRGIPAPAAPAFLPAIPPGVETPEPEVERPRWGTGQDDRRGRGGGSSRPPAPRGRGAVELLPDGIPSLEITSTSFRTTHWEPVVRGHALWLWDFGDGTGQVDPDPNHAIHRVLHRFPREGTYVVTAVSYDGTGRPLIRYRWHVVIPKAALVARGARAVTEVTPGLLDDAAALAARELALTRAFSVAAPQAPQVDLRLEGPAAWVVGRPATFRLEARVQHPPFTERVHVEYDPGPVFTVRWRRPGRFRVDGAVRVRVYYRINGTSIALTSVFRATRTVDVRALHLSR